MDTLKQKGLIIDASVSEMFSKDGYDDDVGFDFFTFSVELTETGLERTNEVIESFFQYINLIRGKGAQEWLWNELKMMEDITFRFKDKESPFGYVTSMAAVMHVSYFDNENRVY